MNKLSKYAVCLIFSVSCFIFAFADEPQVLGRVEVPSIMSATQDLSRLAESVSPGSSIMLVMGLTALTFDPKLKDFDFNSNISAFIFSVGSGASVKVEWGIVLNRKTADFPKKLEYGKTVLRTKDFNGRVMLSPSQELLDSLKSIPEPDKQNTGIIISLSPSRYIAAAPADLEIAKKSILQSITAKYPSAADDGLAQAKLARLKLDYVQYLIAQIAVMDIRLEIGSASVSIDASFKPEQASLLAAFMRLQSGKTGYDGRYPFFAGKLFNFSADLVISDSLRNSALGILNEVSLELSEDEHKMQYVEFLALALKGASGKFAFYVDSPAAGRETVCVRMRSDVSSMTNFQNIVNSKYKEMITDQPALCKLLAYKSNSVASSLYCLPRNDEFVFYASSCSPAEAFANINEDLKNMTQCPDRFKDASILLSISLRDDDNPDIIAVSFPAPDTAKLRLSLASSTIKAMLPSDFNNKTGFKKGKKKIRVEPMD